jgi:KDO2-lipid IV(A) lauroyltransferase
MESKNSNFNARLLYPRYWTTWIWLAIWRLVTLLPYRLLLIIGKFIGLVLHSIPLRRKKIAWRNIQLCFPELDLNAQRKLLRANFISMGIAIMEVGMAWWWPQGRLRELLQLEGFDRLTEKSERGVILLGIHYTSLEIGAAAITTTVEVDGMYKAHKNPVYEYVQLKGRLNHSRDGCKLYERNDLRGSIKSLKQGRILWYLPDQDYGLNQGLFAPFFGVQAATITATAKLAAKTGAAVIPVKFIRLPNAKGYQVSIEPELENFPTGDDLADATRINSLIESFVRLQPDQYLWAHRRFKNRPEGLQDIYND